MTSEERFAHIEESLRQISVNLTTASEMIVEADKRAAKLDKRLDTFLSITMKIGADFAERIKALEDKIDKGEL